MFAPFARRLLFAPLSPGFNAMRTPFLVAALSGSLVVQAQTSLECERYRIERDMKAERSVHRFSLDKTRAFIDYENTSGKPWLLPSPARLQVTWVAQDGLRAVAAVASPQSPSSTLQGLFFVADVHFGRPRLRVESFGGLVDLDEVVRDPWKLECRRLN